MLTQLPEAEQQRHRQHRRAQWRAGEQGVAAALQIEQKRHAGAELQQQGKSACQPALLTQGHPENTGPFDRPGRRCPARIQPQRDGQRAEHHTQRQAGFHQQLCPLTNPPGQQSRQQQVEQAQCQCAESRSELQMTNQSELQAKTHQRRAEQRRGINVIALARRPAQPLAALGALRGVIRIAQRAPRKQQTNGHVHEEEHHQERFGGGQQLRRIGTHAPGETDAEGAEEADQIEQTPGLEPGDGQDAAVEQNEIGKQRHMVAAARRRENRRGKPAQRGRRRQTQRILGHRENRREQGDQHQQGQRRLGIDQRVQAHGGEDRQVQHGNPGALQNQGIALSPVTQPPA